MTWNARSLLIQKKNTTCKSANSEKNGHVEIQERTTKKERSNPWRGIPQQIKKARSKVYYTIDQKRKNTRTRIKQKAKLTRCW